MKHNANANANNLFVALWLTIAGAVAIWFSVRAELSDVAAIAVLLTAFVTAIFRVFKVRDGSLLAITAAVSALLAIAMMYCRERVRGQADQFAAEFFRAHPCAPSFEELLVDSKDWQRIRGNLLAADVSFLGASRTVRYQENGLLRYGFLYDDARAVWISQCKR